MSTFQHFGLYFSPDHVRIARDNRQHAPLDVAWDKLLSESQSDSLAAAQWDGLRYRFDADIEAGERALVAIVDEVGLHNGSDWLDTLASLVTAAQTFEMLSDHPAMTADIGRIWADSFISRLDDLSRDAADFAALERLWWGLLQVAAGIALEDDIHLDAGAEIYQQAVSHDIRPEGYILSMVEEEDGGSLYRQMRAVEALVLMAEAASHVGLDLWGFTVRGVSVTTAAAYIIYYYYYPEKWRWDTVVDSDVKALFGSHGAFLEMVNYRTRPKDVKLLLDEIRPLYSPSAGGLTTLTHGYPPRRGLFG